MFIDDEKKEVNCKVVYFGPPDSGKSESLRYLVSSMNAKEKGELISLSTEDNHTLYFDFVPLLFGKVKEYTLRLHLYTVPGNLIYKTNRQIVTKGTDGIIFVADSRLERLNANKASLNELKESLADLELEWETLPLVFQYNKQDDPHALSSSDLQPIINPEKRPDFSTIATEGNGVLDALQSISQQVLTQLKRN